MTDHFDDRAATWDQDQGTVDRARTVADGIAARVPLSTDHRVLEYGAGTALVAQMLQDRVGALTLVDRSARMREVMQRKIDAGDLPPDARVLSVDLATEPAPEGPFDVIITSMVLHHMFELDRVLTAFHEMIAPGGWVCIADLDEEDGSFHQHVHDFHGHNGFNRDTLTADLEKAGFTDVTFGDAGTVDKEGATFGVFLATARRA